MGGTSTDVALIHGGAAGSLVRTHPSTTACRSTCRWSMCARSAPAAARSPASTPAGMLQVGPEFAGSQPGPDLLRPRRRAPDDHRCQSHARPARPGALRRCAGQASRWRHPRVFARESAGRSAWASKERGRRGASGSANAHMAGAIRLVSLRAATTRATSRFSPSAAPGRCTRSRSRASSASRRCWCRRGRG